jgi:hypothetical protein
VPPATPESLQRGQDLLAKAVTAVGAKPLAGLKGWHRKLKLAATIQGMSIDFGVEETSILPDKLRTVQTTPFGNMTQVLDGQAGWSDSPRGKKDLTPAEVAKARESLTTDLMCVLRDRARLQCQALDPVQVDGQTRERVYVTGAGSDYLLYYLDPSTGLPTIEETKAQSPVTGAPVTQQTVYGEFGDYAGLKLPRLFTIKHDGEPFATGTVELFELNPVVGPDTFKK